MFWSMHSGIIAAIAVVFARFVSYFAPLGDGDGGIRTVAIAAVLVLSAVNYYGVALGSGLQAALTIGKVLAIVAIVVLGFWLGAGLPVHFGASSGPKPSLTGLAAAVAAGLFTFGGWHMVTYTAEETRNPQRTIPRALILGTLLVTAVYVALNAVYLYVLPFDRVVASNRIAAGAAGAVLARGRGTVIGGDEFLSDAGVCRGVGANGAWGCCCLAW